MLKGGRVESWAIQSLEAGLVSSGVIVDESKVAHRLEELFRRLEISPGRVVVGLGGLNSVFRIITMPELSQELLSEAVKREAGRVIPVSLDEVYLSHQRIPSPVGETRLFLAALPRSDVDILVRTLRRAGIKPYLLEPAPVALCRLVSEPNAIIANSLSGLLDVIVMVHGIAQVIRSISLPDDPSESIATIAEEFDRTIAFYNTSHPEEPLDSSVPVFVGGHLLRLPDSWQLRSRGHGPASALTSPLEHPESLPTSEFMVNIGLALKVRPLKEAGASLVNFNAMPDIYLPKPLSLLRIAGPIGLVVGIGALLWLGFLGQLAAHDTAALRSQLALVEQQMEAPVPRIAALGENITQVEAQIKPVQAINTMLKAKIASFKEERELVYEDSFDVVKTLPGGVLLLKVQHSGDRITISGFTEKEHMDGPDGIGELRTNIFDYAKNLKNTGRFSEVIISSIDYMPRYIEVTTEEVETEIKFDRLDFVFLLKRG